MCYKDAGTAVTASCLRRPGAGPAARLQPRRLLPHQPEAGQLPGDPLERRRQRLPDRGDDGGRPDADPVPDDATADAEHRRPTDDHAPTPDDAEPDADHADADDQPDPDRRPTRPTSPTPTAAADAAGDPLTVSDATTTSVRLSWPAAARAPGTASCSTAARSARTRSTAVRDRRPAAGDRVPGADRRCGAAARTPRVTVRTRGRDQPPPGGWFRCRNALTGAAADLYGSRGPTGPRWSLAGRPAAQPAVAARRGRRGYQLRSKATGSASRRRSATAGAPLVQRACDAAA